ncbi:hypothetical protein GCM10022403_080070 [Streptomyces coacervatus]|uniref:Uncharacterized protein n=1 Tax=Streptomyces coacervatus TaxID=647381 RepID=A0ABP7J5N4_9ACTN
MSYRDAPRRSDRMTDASGQVYGQQSYGSREWTPVVGPLGTPVRSVDRFGRALVRDPGLFQEPRPGRDQLGYEISSRSGQPLYELPRKYVVPPQPAPAPTAAPETELPDAALAHAIITRLFVAHRNGTLAPGEWLATMAYRYRYAKFL